jgi:hypothetical protein
MARRPAVSTISTSAKDLRVISIGDLVKAVIADQQRLLPLLAAAVWALDRHAEPMPDDIVRRYDVSRATAYRWLRKIRSARTELQALRSEPA